MGQNSTEQLTKKSRQAWKIKKNKIGHPRHDQLTNDLHVQIERPIVLNFNEFDDYVAEKWIQLQHLTCIFRESTLLAN